MTGVLGVLNTYGVLRIPEHQIDAAHLTRLETLEITPNADVLTAACSLMEADILLL